MDKVRIGIIGYGKMGSQHVKSFVDGKIPNAVLTCVADIDEKRIEAAKALLGDSVSYFSTAEDLIHSGACDAVIPTVPLYIGILFKVMQKKGIHEGCIEQMYRLISEKLFNGGEVPVDSDNRIRLDDWELREDVQKEVLDEWNKLTKDNVKEIADLALFRKDYMNMHGFDEEGIDYSQDVKI